MMTVTSVKKIDQDKIPVIDIGPLIDGKDPEKVSRDLHDASQNLGFIYIKGHGIPNDLINNVRENAIHFFRSSDKEKQKVKITKSHRGWLGYGGAVMNSKDKADLKESFIWGMENSNGVLPDSHPLRGQNIWPKNIPNFKNLAMEYFDHAHRVAKNLMQGFAIGLGLDEKFFLKTNSKPLSRASFVYYPPQPIEMGDDQFGVGEHTDFGVLTVLCQDLTGGLQVKDVNGDWLQAPPIEGTLVVNVADLLSRWTDGAYKSTPHRVINNSGKERLSLVLAYDPDPETLIDAKEIYGKKYQPKEEAITCGDYLNWRFNKAFSYRRK